MTIPLFTPTEQYVAFRILRQTHLNALAASVKTQFDTYTRLNFTQIGLDVYGVTYGFNNDGLATQVTPLVDLVGQLAQNETVTGSWTFSGAVAFSGAVTATSIISSTGQPRARVFINVAQSVLDSTITAINFTSETYDVAAVHDAGNQSRLTIPTSGGGLYSIVGQVTFANN